MLVISPLLSAQTFVAINQQPQKPDKQQPAITFAQLQQLYRQQVIDADGWRFAEAQWFPLHWQR